MCFFSLFFFFFFRSLHFFAHVLRFDSFNQLCVCVFVAANAPVAVAVVVVRFSYNFLDFIFDNSVQCYKNRTTHSNCYCALIRLISAAAAAAVCVSFSNIHSKKIV